MRWSQLKSNLDALRAPALGQRVALHQARYRYTREEVGRIWITVDGREIVSFDTSSYLRRHAQLRAGLEQSMGGAGADSTGLEPDKRATEMLRESGQYGDYQALDDLEAYLSLSIEDALVSPSPLIRALAVIDRRVGKRRLRTLDAGTLEHELVRELYRLRCDAEGIERQPAGSVIKQEGTP